MAKLPATSYVRLVDIWLIFGQLMPFIEVTSFFLFSAAHNIICLINKKVSLTTIVELYNEDDNTINHHGFNRDVQAKGNKIEEKVKKIILIMYFIT